MYTRVPHVSGVNLQRPETGVNLGDWGSNREQSDMRTAYNLLLLSPNMISSYRIH